MLTKTGFKKGYTPWNKGKKMSEETRKRMSESQKGIKRNSPSEETRRKISEKLKGRTWKPDRFCLVCGKNGVRKDRKYCSQQCAGVAVKGKETWITGKKHTEEARAKMRGEKNGVWKGELVGYQAVHSWMRKYKQHTECEKCGATEKLEWANKNHTYERVLEDYIELCPSCHRKYDIENNGYAGNKKNSHRV